MSDAAAQLENFMQEVSENRKRRKTVGNITEVRHQHFSDRTVRQFKPSLTSFILSSQKSLDPLNESAPTRKLISVSSENVCHFILLISDFKLQSVLLLLPY